MEKTMKNYSLYLKTLLKFCDSVNDLTTIFGLNHTTIKLISFKYQDLNIILKFDKERLSGIYCQFPEDSFLQIPRLIIKHCYKGYMNCIKILDKDFFMYHINESIKDIINIQQSDDAIMAIKKIFNNFKESVNEEYKNYLMDTRKWLKKNRPDKRKSFYDLWNIPRRNGLINMDENEYRTKLNKELPEGFVSFKVVVLERNSAEFEVRLLVSQDEGIRYYRYLVDDKVRFEEVLETFAQWVAGNEIQENPEFFKREEGNRILKYVLNNSFND